mgnify:CR=1 FL=1
MHRRVNKIKHQLQSSSVYLVPLLTALQTGCRENLPLTQAGRKRQAGWATQWQHRTLPVDSVSVSCPLIHYPQARYVVHLVLPILSAISSQAACPPH